MGGVLTGNVVLRHPDTQGTVVLTAGSTVPDWAEGLVGEHLLADEEATPAADSEGGDEPPRSGKGSGKAAWKAYAESLGVTVGEDDDRDTIIAAVDALET